MLCTYSITRCTHTHSYHARSEVSETSDGGTSAVLDPNGRAHNVKRLINSGSPRQSNNQTTYNQPDQSSQNNLTQFPSRTFQNDTLVLSDAMINNHFYKALQSSTQALSLALSDDPQNNQSGSTIPPYTPTASDDFLPEELFQELAGINQIEPMISDFLNSEYNSYSYDNSSAHSGYTPLSNAGAPDSSMVIGLGNDFDKTHPYSLSLPGGGGMVFNEQQHAVAVRKNDFGIQEPNSTQMDYQLFSAPKDDSVHSILMPHETAFPDEVNVQPIEESVPPSELPRFSSCEVSSNQLVQIKITGEVYDVSVFTGDKAEFAQYFPGIDDTRQCTKFQDQDAALQHNNGFTTAIQPRMQASCGEQDSSTSQPSKHRGRHNNYPPDKCQQFRKNMQDEKYPMSMKEIAKAAKCRWIFAAHLNQRSFSVEERRTSNVSGTKSKKRFDTHWINVIKKVVFQHFPIKPNETKEQAWKHCVTAIHSLNRKL